MGYYSMGLKNQVQVGAWVSTPGLVKDEIIRLSTEIESAEDQMVSLLFIRDSMGFHIEKPGANKKLVEWYWMVWRPFYTGWLQFKKENMGFWDGWWGNSWDRVQNWRKRFNTIYESGKSIGMEYSGPPPSKPESGPFSRAAEEIWSLVKTIVYALLAIGAGYLLLSNNGPKLLKK